MKVNNYPVAEGAEEADAAEDLWKLKKMNSRIERR
jgi:hypothetical protein